MINLALSRRRRDLIGGDVVDLAEAVVKLWWLCVGRREDYKLKK